MTNQEIAAILSTSGLIAAILTYLATEKRVQKKPWYMTIVFPKGLKLVKAFFVAMISLIIATALFVFLKKFVRGRRIIPSSLRILKVRRNGRCKVTSGQSSNKESQSDASHTSVRPITFISESAQAGENRESRKRRRRSEDDISSPCRSPISCHAPIPLHAPNPVQRGPLPPIPCPLPIIRGTPQPSCHEYRTFRISKEDWERLNLPFDASNVQMSIRRVGSAGNCKSEEIILEPCVPQCADQPPPSPECEPTPPAQPDCLVPTFERKRGYMDICKNFYMDCKDPTPEPPPPPEKCKKDECGVERFVQEFSPLEDRNGRLVAYMSDGGMAECVP